MAAPRSSRWVLGVATVAVAFAAADTYVVVLALVDMMQGIGLSPDQLQRAAPIISGFLLGYVAVLPLIGRIADLRGRPPVLVAALVVFAVGSAVTALAYDMPTLVGGRFLQGVGGGGLVPATLALVADLYPVERRGVPLGVVSAVQELGSVLGPLLGALLLALGGWRVIFAVNLVVGLLLAAALRAGTGPLVERARGRLPDLLGLALLAVVAVAGGLVFVQPAFILRQVTWGRLLVPLLGDHRWTSPLGLVALAALVLLLVRCLTARRPLVDLRAWGAAAREADVAGAAWLALALGGVVLAFATADPKVQVFSDQGWWYLLGSAVATVALVWHLRRADDPLVPRGALAARPAHGGLLVSFLVGGALIAALVDVPLFARTTVYTDSQVLAALVLVRFLVALPVGAIVGGWLTRSTPTGVVTAIGMALAAVGFVLMSRWGPTSLEHPSSTVPLVLAGLGFGLALAPVNAAVLATTREQVHGLASALVVVARMVGMLVGASALTTLGLRRYYAEQADLPTIASVCGPSTTRCDAYTALLKSAAIAQEQTVFLGAAALAVAAGLAALWAFRGAPTRAVSPSVDGPAGVPRLG